MMDGECSNCGESGNWCRCDDDLPEMDADRSQFVRITRPGGHTVTVSPLVGQKTLEALDRVAELVRRQYGKDPTP
jgi:hypothetical protein